MGPQEELRVVDARVLLVFRYHNLGACQGVRCLYHIRRSFRVPVHIVQNPVLQEALHACRTCKTAYLVANYALQVVRKAACCKQVRKARAEIGVGSRRRVLELRWLVNRLGPKKNCRVGILAVTQGHQAILRQFRFTPIGNRNLGGALDIDAAIIGRKSMCGQALHRPTRLHAVIFAAMA